MTMIRAAVVGTAVGLGACAAVLRLGAAESPVHLLLPGFVAEELPVHLPNANNLRFAPDGSLTVLGYDGRIWRVTDTNGDGLEDTATLWWDRPTLTVPVGMCWTTAGLLVSSSGKVSLLRDADGDGRAETEEVLAEGWTGKDTASGNVDATGVTMGPDGRIYFALLTANYANPYRLKKVAQLAPEERIWWLSRQPKGTSLPADDMEVSLYDPVGERGSVQRLDPTTGRRETFATGLRVVYQLAFNAKGDLFCTDQEGETWCPNGNPLDELNHIVQGRNYGFPPRHERWLPNLQSEVPVAAFGPQHQSTCGLIFNDPHPASGRLESSTAKPRPAAISVAQALFGPESWRGDALVAGESRGKIWRVALEKTANGYRGTQQPIARLAWLTTDVTISARGDLYVSCHSGLPDWGTGPNGDGKLFRIRYVDRAAPQPTHLALVDGGRRLEVTWDRPLAKSVTQEFAAVRLESGLHVRAADRWETLKPPYEAVKRQEAAPRERQTASQLTLSADGRVLSIATPRPLRSNWSHALILPEVRNTEPASPAYTVDLELIGPETPETAGAPVSVAAGSAASQRPVGDFETGRSLFTKLNCATCHRLRGEGGGQGPDLDNLASRDDDSILTDLREPNTRINPDYVGYDVTLRDGTTLTGFLRTQKNDTLKIIGATGTETLVKPNEVGEMRPSGQSLMPAGLLDGLKENEVNGLLTFLRHAPPRWPDTLPKPAASAALTNLNPAIHLVLVASKQDHGSGQHDYPHWQTNWLHWITGHGLAAESAWEWPSPSQFSSANVIIFYFWNHDWNSARLAELDAYQRRGGGVVLLHSACIADHDPESLVTRFGLASHPVRTGYRHMPFHLQLMPGHRVTQGLPATLEFLDEPYWPLIGDPAGAGVTVLGTGEVDGVARPLIWAFERAGGGRTFGSILGHYTWTFEDPWFRELIIRGIAWAAQP